VFGGVIFRDSIKPVNDSRDLEFTAMGHLKELERYPAFLETKEPADYLGQNITLLPKTTGIGLVSVDTPDFEGVRDLKYKFGDKKQIKGLVINSLSTDTPVGWHIIKFKPPDQWQYDYGTWATKSEGATGQTLTSAKGHSINIDLPDEFDVSERTDIFYIESRISREVEKIGGASLQFSNGKEKQLFFDFDIVIRYDNGATSYNDITFEANTPDSDEVDLIEAVGDVIYIMSSKPFYGVYFDLSETLSLDASLDYDYNDAFDSWASLNSEVNDDTWAFRESGAMTWDPQPKWKRTDVVVNSVYYENVYCLRLTCLNADGQPAKARRISPYMNLVAEDGITLIVKNMLEYLPEESTEDEIILRNDSNDNIQPCAWKENLSFQNYLESLMDASNYTSG